MRRAVLALALPLASLVACAEPDLSDLAPIFTCERPLFPSDACVDADHPVDFFDDGVRLAAGGGDAIDVLILEGTDVVFESDTPSIVELAPGADGTFDLTARAVGHAQITARRPDGALLASLPVEVAPITSIGLAFDPLGARPLTRLAALPGATERIRVIATDEHGQPLRGARKAVQLEARGPLSLASLADAERRGGSVLLFGQPTARGFEQAIRFDALGSGELVARAGAVETTLPVDMIEAASEVELVLALPEIPVDWFQLVDLIGRDDRGVPVAGLLADWQVSPAGLAELRDPHGGQAVVFTRGAGTITVTAALPDRTLTTRFEIVPR